MDHRYIASALSPGDARRVSEVVADIDGESIDIALNGRSLGIDPSAGRAVVALLTQLASGTAVTIGPVNELLTTSQAAEILGVSDTYVRKLADAGQLTIEMRGTHRRFRLEDLVRHRETKKARQASANPARSDET